GLAVGGGLQVPDVGLRGAGQEADLLVGDVLDGRGDLEVLDVGAGAVEVVGEDPGLDDGGALSCLGGVGAQGLQVCPVLVLVDPGQEGPAVVLRSLASDVGVDHDAGALDAGELVGDGLLAADADDLQATGEAALLGAGVDLGDLLDGGGVLAHGQRPGEGLAL